MAKAIPWSCFAYIDRALDGDDPKDINWLLDVAQKRASKFGISGITYSLTQGVVKNIIPAIASTNAIIAAACANEAFKMATNSAKIMNNYMMYTGDEGIYSYTFELEKNPDCAVCGTAVVKLAMNRQNTLQDLIDALIENPTMYLPLTKSTEKTIPARDQNIVHAGSSSARRSYTAQFETHIRIID